MRKFKFLAAVAAAMTLQAAPASALTLVATWTGTVSGLSTNFTSRMGFGALEPLNGKDFTAQMTYDPAVGQFTNLLPGERRRGGDAIPQFGPSPVLSGWLEIAGGNRITLNTHTTGEISSRTGQGVSMRGQELTGAAGLDTLTLNATFNASGLLSSVLPLTSVTGTGSFKFASFNPAQGFDPLDAEGGLTVRSLLISEYVAPPPGGGAVPEPSTWALMILGFGAAGAILRRRYPRLAR